MPPQFMALPTELLDVVASHVPVHDLPALCRANHRLYDVCLRWIYHTLSPATVARAVEIFKVLVSNEVAGAFVKVFIIRLRFDGVFKSFTRLMAKALINLTSLESLNCSFSPRVFSSLSLTSFPRLLDCKIPFCADAVVFLRLHPTLVKLRLIPDFSLARPTYSSSPISLPVLREFSGPAWAAREIVPHSSIEVVTLAWNESFPETYHIVLNGFSGIQQPLRVMNNLVFTWDPVFLLAIAKHLPRLAVCNIWKMVTAWPGDNTLEAFYDALKTAILDLTHLVIFSCTLDVEEAPPTSPTPADLALEFAVVSELGSRSAVLQMCTLASNTTWHRGGANFWYPRAADKNPMESDRCLRWLIEVAVRRPAEFPGYVNELERMLGKVEWTTLINNLGLSAE